MAMPAAYPYAVKTIEPDKYLRTPWIGGSPKGITLHDSAGGSLDGAISALVAGGLRYHLLIDRDGSVVQLAHFTQGVWHAGTALWNGKSPNRQHLSICLIGYGPLKRQSDGTGLSETGNLIPAANMALRCGNLSEVPGYWHAATPAQLESLRKACLWMMSFGIKSSEICGHDEAAIPRGRKQDPGGMLPWTMPEFRRYIEAQRAVG